MTASFRAERGGVNDIGRPVFLLTTSWQCQPPVPWLVLGFMCFVAFTRLGIGAASLILSSHAIGLCYLFWLRDTRWKPSGPASMTCWFPGKVLGRIQCAAVSIVAVVAPRRVAYKYMLCLPTTSQNLSVDFHFFKIFQHLAYHHHYTEYYPYLYHARPISPDIAGARDGMGCVESPEEAVR